jgi:hypothetical protein
MHIMIDYYKAVFLPTDNRILNLFKGYILNGESLSDIKNSDVYTETKYYEFNGLISRTEKIIRVVVMIALVPIFIFILMIAAIFKRFEKAGNKIKYSLDSFFSIFFKKKKVLQVRRRKNKKYVDAIEEDVPEFLNHCQKNFVKVYLYSYRQLTNVEKLKVENLIKSGFISSCETVSKLSDLIPFINAERISIRNSLLIISDSNEKHEANLLGFHSGNGYERNVELLGKKNFSEEGGEGELEWNSHETIIGLKREIEYSLKAKSNTFLTNDSILFIEDKRDDFLNSYIQRNLERINKRLKEKNMQLIYFPSFQLEHINNRKPILEFLRYRLPVLYSLTDSELSDAIQILFKKISSVEFYRIVLEELELSFFKKPCLLRNIFDGSAETKNKFTYKHIEYETKEDLDKLFDWYIEEVKIPIHIAYYSSTKPPVEYDADWYFGIESKQDTEELKQRIDAIKAEGKFGVLADAIMYILETIKDEKPEIHCKVKPMLEKRKLLESKVILSRILIDKRYNIFLTDFGNREVKMHALPKTVYIFFLKHLNGVRFKELYQHKTELLEIYNLITNISDKEEIEEKIKDLVDMKKNSINEKCSNIRASFRKIMDEHIAKHYYIDGMNGEPKKISLPNDLIEFHANKY